jgi:glyoxylate reductase
MLLGAEIYRQTLGIIGAGRIGTAVARRAHGFGMNILYADTQPNRLIEKDYGARKSELENLIRNSDFISLHIPLMDTTHHLIDEKRFQQMKSTVFLINTSRGAVVDEQALVWALHNRIIGGAGLDVYEREPLLAEGLVSFKNVVLLPHLGSATLQTRAKMAELAAINIIEFAQGNPAPNTVGER